MNTVYRASAICILALIVLGASIACAPKPHVPDDRFDSPPPVQDTRWRLVELQGERYIPSELWRTPHLLLSSDTSLYQLAGPCNNAWGHYAWSASGLTFEPGKATRLGCPREEAGIIEALFFTLIIDTRQWRMDGYYLELLSGEDSVLARFEPREE